MSAIYQRASVRQYTNDPVTDDDVRAILRAAMAAPSAGNQQPWEFWVTRDEAKREELAAASKYATPCRRAPLVLTFCLRIEARFPSMLQQDMGACVENALIEAADLGLGAVWMGIYPEADRMEAVRAALALPDGVEPFALVAVGHPADTPEPQGAARFDDTRIHWE
ncbi:MAG: nitroreductase family protein [Atopobiaceae bacterium]|nr:nitroreductase family protein [Atopobiaceae bacterium]